VATSWRVVARRERENLSDGAPIKASKPVDCPECGARMDRVPIARVSLDEARRQAHLPEMQSQPTGLNRACRVKGEILDAYHAAH
jgi:hypothetical protein